MKDKDKTKEQLIKELAAIHRRVTKIETSETRHKKVEKKLKLLSSIVEQSTEGMALADLNGNLIFINKAWCKMHGYKSSKSLLGKNLAVFHNKEQLKNDVIPFNEKVQKYGTYSGEVGHITKEGKPFPTLMSTTLLKDEHGNPFALSGIVKDITKRKKAEEELKATNQQLEVNNEQLRASEKGLKKEKEFSEKIIETSNAVIVGLDKDHLIRIFNKGAEKITGYDSKNVLGKDWFKIFFPPEIIDDMDKVWKDAWGTTAHSYINPIRIKNGDERIISWQTTGMYEGENEKNHMLISIGEDITKHKQAEEALQASEERYRNVVENAGELIWQVDTKGNFVFFNKFAEQVSGQKSVDWQGKHYTPFVHPDDLARINKILEDTLAGNIIEYETRIFNNKGEIVDLEIQTMPIYVEGEVTGTLNFGRNITERKQAEEALRESERKYRSLFESIPDVITTIDEQGIIISANNSVKRILGYEPSDLLGKPVEILAPEELRSEQNENIIKAINKGFLESQETIRVAKDGTPIPMDISVFASKDSTGNLFGVSAIMRDITERKTAEIKLKKSRNQLRSLAGRLQMIREEERATVAREIHDDLGQTLTALKMDISWMKKNPGMTEEIRAEKINAILGLTDSTIQTVKRIATELRPGILDDLGLIPAIEWETEEFRKRSGINCNLEISVEEISIEDNISIAVFRIFQESLTNIVRHSGATKVELTIKSKGDLIQMEITDNGVGITEEQMRSPKSLGLMGMNERVSFFGGKLAISKSEVGGTTVRVYIPIIKVK